MTTLMRIARAVLYALKLFALGLIGALLLMAVVTASPARATPTTSATAEIMAALNYVDAEFPAAFHNVAVYSAPLAEGTYAQTDAAGITFNSRYVENPAQWDADYYTDVLYGYHPAGCDAPSGTAYHEAAHVINRHSNRVAETILLARVRDGSISGTVSGYALQSPSEALSEAFMAVHCNGGNSTERAIYAVLASVA